MSNCNFPKRITKIDSEESRREVNIYFGEDQSRWKDYENEIKLRLTVGWKIVN